MLTDEQLYSRLLQGDNTALDELLVRHKEGLTFFIYGVVHNLEDAEDLMMDTFAMLLAKRVRFKNESSFKTWLYGIGRNLANNYLRKHKIELQDQMDETAVCNFSDTPDSDILTAERNRAIYQAMKNLKPEYAEVLYLSFFAGMNVNQIASVMKKTVKQIYNLTDRAKKQLKELVDESISS